MTSEDAVLSVIAALDALNIPYMLVGAFSANYYGIARSTKDADFVVQLGSESVSRIAQHLGAGFRLDPQTSFETATLTTRHILEVVGIPFRIELFHLSEDPHDQERFRRRRRVEMRGSQVHLPTAEDVIITKLRWAANLKRAKDRDDVCHVIAVKEKKLDWPYICFWCDQHGTRGLLDEIRQSIPPLDLPGQAEPRASS